MHRLAAREHARARGPLLRNAHSQRMRALSAVHAPLIRTRARALHTSALYQKVSDLQTHSALCAPATVHTCTHLHTLSEGFCTHCLTCTHLHASAAHDLHTYRMTFCCITSTDRTRVGMRRRPQPPCGPDGVGYAIPPRSAPRSTEEGEGRGLLSFDLSFEQCVC